MFWQPWCACFGSPITALSMVSMHVLLSKRAFSHDMYIQIPVEHVRPLPSEQRVCAAILHNVDQNRFTQPHYIIHQTYSSGRHHVPHESCSHPIGYMGQRWHPACWHASGSHPCKSFCIMLTLRNHGAPTHLMRATLVFNCLSITSWWWVGKYHTRKHMG